MKVFSQAGSIPEILVENVLIAIAWLLGTKLDNQQRDIPLVLQ